LSQSVQVRFNDTPRREGWIQRQAGKRKEDRNWTPIIQIDQDLRSDVATEFRETRGKTAELVERKAAAKDQLMRLMSDFGT
jgi:hypothetical protein